MFKEAVSSERLFHFPEKRFYCKASRRCNGFLGSGQYSWRTRREPGAVARSYFLLCFSNKYHQFLWLLRDPSDTSDICERLQQVILGLGFFFFSLPAFWPRAASQYRSLGLIILGKRESLCCIYGRWKPWLTGVWQCSVEEQHRRLKMIFR